MIRESRQTRLITVIVPTIGRNSIKLTVQSLLNQTVSPEIYGVVLVDDCSTSSYDWLPPEIELVRLSKPLGPGGARNAGLAISRTPYVAFTDDDCTVPATWLESIIRGFENYPEAVTVNGYLKPPDYQVAHSPFARLEYYEALVDERINQPVLGLRRARPAGGGSNIAWRTDSLNSLGGFQPLIVGQDGDLERRADSLGLVGLFLPIPVIHNRTYSAARFWRQHYWRGLNYGTFGPAPSLIRSMARLLRSPLRAYPYWLRGDLGVAFASVIRDIAFTAGNLRSRDKATSSTVLVRRTGID